MVEIIYEDSDTLPLENEITETPLTEEILDRAQCISYYWWIGSLPDQYQYSYVVNIYPSVIKVKVNIGWAYSPHLPVSFERTINKSEYKEIISQIISLNIIKYENTHLYNLHYCGAGSRIFSILEEGLSIFEINSQWLGDNEMDKFFQSFLTDNIIDFLNNPDKYKHLPEFNEIDESEIVMLDISNVDSSKSDLNYEIDFDCELFFET